MTKAARTRMSVDARRRQLLDVGVELVSTRRVEDISIDDVIARAGVSRALFYHYFTNKRDFFVQAVARASEQIAAATEPAPGAPLVRQLELAIDGYLDYAGKHAASYRAVYQSVFSGDPDVRRIIAEGFEQQETKIVAAIAERIEPTPLVRAAVHGWLAFLVWNCLEWIETGEPSREQLRDLCKSVLLAAVAAAAEHE